MRQETSYRKGVLFFCFCQMFFYLLSLINYELVIITTCEEEVKTILAKLWLDLYFPPTYTVYFCPMGAVNNHSAFIKVQNFISVKFYHLLWKP